MTSTHRDRTTSALVAAALLGPVIAGLGTWSLLSAREQLPDRLVVHWGLDGPDRWVSVPQFLWVTGLTTALVPLLIVALALGPKRRPSPFSGS